MIKPPRGQITLRALAVGVTLTMLQNSDGWAASPTPLSSAPATPLPEVTVTARRLELEQRVSKFVSQIAVTENGSEGLARWEVPAVCPLVSGLPRQNGEFILERLSEVAHAAGVPLAGEHCHPNLYILVTSQAEDLLKGMEKRNRTYTFGVDASSYPPVETPANIVDEFIKTPRPVRVWHNITEKDAWGQPLAYCQSQMALPPPPLCSETSIINPAACNPNRYYRCGSAIAGGSHLVLNSMWTLSRVFVIVDQRRLQGVTLGQLADYVAMSGLAKLRPDARLGDAPTIMKLFDAAPQAAPAGMTDWDRAFLKSLYTTQQTSRLQRSQIARSMVRQIAP